MATQVTYKGSTIASFTNTSKTLKTSGKYMEDDVTVSESISLQSKTVTPTTSMQTITADSGYDALSSVVVNAMPAGSVTVPASISGTSATVSVGTNTLTFSKTISVTPSVTTAGYVSSGTAGNAAVSLTATVSTRSSSSLTRSGATITAPAGYYENSATKTVQMGTAGTPTASKGAVSNHSVSVTPSVTNQAGYIYSETKTGTAVSVSASELVSGTKSISANGTEDVTNYASVNVAVPQPSGTKNITISANGTTTEDVTNYASASITANVPNSYSASDEGKVVNNGALVAQTSDTVTENDTYDTTLINSLTVNVSGSSDADGYLTSILQNSKIEDLEYTLPAGNVYFGTLKAKNVTIHGATAIANNAALSSNITGIISLPDVTYAGTSTWATSPVNATCIYLPKLSTAGNNFFIGASKPNLVKFVSGTKNPITNTGSSGSFRGTTALKALVLNVTSVPSLGSVAWASNSALKNDADAYIYVPKALKASFETASNWSTFQFRAIEDYPLINAPTTWLPTES